MTEKTPEKSQGKGRTRKAKSDTAPPFDRRLMEKQMAAMARLLEEKDFATIEEANAFLANFTHVDMLPQIIPETPLEQAQEIVYEAMEATGKRRLTLARKALEVSPDCADAYVLLAEESKSARQARPLYEQGVQAGERALGKDYFAEDASQLWDDLEARPYMRARLGLAETLWELGEREAAIGHAQDMLRLNPNDNQGVRYLLAGWLSITGDYTALGRLLDQYPEEDSASWAYTRLLHTFREDGPGASLDKAFIRAMESNPFVPMYLLGVMPLPEEPPDYYEMGTPDEALVYLVEAGEAWAEHVEVIAWMVDALTRLAPTPRKARTQRKPKAAKPTAENPKPKPKMKPAKVWTLDPKTSRAESEKS